MSKKHSWKWVLLASVLALGWLLGTPGVAAALQIHELWNMEYLGSADFVGNGEVDQFICSNLAPWPRIDRYFSSGCYYSNRGCFAMLDMKDQTQPKIVATVESYDVINSPKPPSGDPVWTDDAYNNLPSSTLVLSLVGVALPAVVAARIGVHQTRPLNEWIRKAFFRNSCRWRVPKPSSRFRYRRSQ